MAEVKGKFITLAGNLMKLYKNALDFCDNILYEKIGLHYHELDPEGWYDTKIFNGFMVNYAKASLAKDKAIITLGRKVYPTIEKTVGIPSNIQKPLDLIIYEAQGFLLNHRGADVVPRKFLKKEDGHVIVQAPAPGYSQKLYEGVYLGILEMYDIKNGNVEMTKGAPHFEYEIKW